MHQQVLNFGYKKSNLSIQQSFNLVLKKVEVLMFSFLCIICIIASKVSEDFVKDVSFVFVGISTPIVETISFPFNATIGILTDFNDLVKAKSCYNKAIEIDNNYSPSLKALNSLD